MIDSTASAFSAAFAGFFSDTVKLESSFMYCSAAASLALSFLAETDRGGLGDQVLE